MLHWVIEDDPPRYAFRDLLAPRRASLVETIFLQARRLPRASAMANDE